MKRSIATYPCSSRTTSWSAPPASAGPITWVLCADWCRDARSWARGRTSCWSTRRNSSPRMSPAASRRHEPESIMSESACAAFSSTGLRHVIIGAGTAGVTAAQTLRRLDPKATITLLDGEGEQPYSRMAIPYLLAGQIDEAGVRIHREPDYYRNNGIELLTQRAIAIDGRAHAVTLADGRRLSYDRLLIATGSTPKREPVAGIDV